MGPLIFKGAMVMRHLNGCADGDNWIALQVEDGRVIATCSLNRSLSTHELGYSYFLYVDKAYRLRLRDCPICRSDELRPRARHDTD